MSPPVTSDGGVWVVVVKALDHLLLPVVWFIVHRLNRKFDSSRDNALREAVKALNMRLDGLEKVGGAAAVNAASANRKAAMLLGRDSKEPLTSPGIPIPPKP